RVMEVSAQPMLVLVRGLARLAADEFLDLEQLHAGPVARLWPVDELLGAAAPAASALSRVLGRCVVLCGHSLGCAVAQCLAQQLRVCGLDARGLVALDARTPAPRPLLLREAALHVAAPLAPALRSREAGVARGSRGSREAWARGARGLGLAAELGAQSWRHLLDAEHRDLPASHGWDLAELLERCFVYRDYDSWDKALAAVDGAMPHLVAYGDVTHWARHHARGLRCLVLQELERDAVAYMALAEHAAAAWRIMPRYCDAVRSLHQRLAEVHARLPWVLQARLQEKAKELYGESLESLDRDMAKLKVWLIQAGAVQGTAAVE
ncbi:unnamed protein product, partial [Effrenium voratum]